MQSLALDLPQSLGATQLRALRHSDLPRFASYRADPSLAEFQSWEPMSLAASQAFLNETVGTTHLTPGEWVQLAVAEVAEDLLAGDVGLFLSEDLTFAEVGFTLGREAQGKGHATLAVELAVAQVFRLPTVLEIRAVTDELNYASVAVLRRAKFLQAGLQQAVFKGKPCTELLFARRR